MIRLLFPSRKHSCPWFVLESMTSTALAKYDKYFVAKCDISSLLIMDTLTHDRLSEVNHITFDATPMVQLHNSTINPSFILKRWQRAHIWVILENYRLCFSHVCVLNFTSLNLRECIWKLQFDKRKCISLKVR